MLQCVLRWVDMCCSVCYRDLQCVAECCSVLQCVAVCYSVLLYVVVCVALGFICVAVSECDFRITKYTIVCMYV